MSMLTCFYVYADMFVCNLNTNDLNVMVRHNWMIIDDIENELDLFTPAADVAKLTTMATTADAAANAKAANAETGAGATLSAVRPAVEMDGGDGDGDDEDSEFGAEHADISKLYMRIERQTLTRLPLSNAILFNIHTHQHHLSYLAEHPDAAAQFKAALTLASNSQAKEYKNYNSWARATHAFLDGVARESEKPSARTSKL